MGFEDGLRNSFTNLKAFMKKLGEAILQLKEKMTDDERIKKIEEAEDYLSVLTNETDIIARRTENFLSTIKFRASDLVVREHDLWDFIQNVAGEFKAEKREDQLDLHISLDFKKLSRTKAEFDYERMKKCLKIIMDNAVRSGAKNIWIRALSRSTTAGKGNLIITVTNDGQKMDQVMARQILMLFSGVGYEKGESGLALANLIVRAHKGELRPVLNPKLNLLLTYPNKIQKPLATRRMLGGYFFKKKRVYPVVSFAVLRGCTIEEVSP